MYLSNVEIGNTECHQFSYIGWESCTVMPCNVSYHTNFIYIGNVPLRTLLCYDELQQHINHTFSQISASKYSLIFCQSIYNYIRFLLASFMTTCDQNILFIMGTIHLKF